MSDLIEVLKSANVGSRALDWSLAHEWGFSGGVKACPEFTTSLDAAVGLKHRLLPGWWWTAGQCGLTCHASVGPDRAFIAEPDLSKYDDGFHADIANPSTPVLALCVAILEARRTTNP